MGKKRLDEHNIPTLPTAIEALAEQRQFGGSERLAVAARAIMAQHTKKLYAHLPGVLGGDDPHDVHQMRVATRRLRASLQATAAAYRPQRVKALARHLRQLARSLGEVRDRDVLLLRLRADAEAEANDTEMQAALGRLQDERETAHAELVAELGRKRTRRLLQELTDFLTCPLEDIQAEDDGLPLLVRHYAGSALWREYEAVRRFETVMVDASSERMHELRITAKHLRYALELFEPALGEAARDIIEQVTALQEHLGNLHDADVAIAYLHAQHAQRRSAQAENKTEGALPEVVTADQGQDARLNHYIEMRTRERDELLASAEPMWQRIVGDDARSRFAHMIGAL